MPWKASSVMEERLRFVGRLLDGEAMTDVCREFGISRKTGYKIFDRYKEHGLVALSDRSRRPIRYANQLPPSLESLIVRLKGEKPHWGARKIRELLVRRLDGDVRIPAKSTIHAVLDRHGLVKRGGSPRHRARGTPLSEGAIANDLWCADFKGEFKLGNGRSPFSRVPVPTCGVHAKVEYLWFPRAKRFRVRNSGTVRFQRRLFEFPMLPIKDIKILLFLGYAFGYPLAVLAPALIDPLLISHPTFPLRHYPYVNLCFLIYLLLTAAQFFLLRSAKKLRHLYLSVCVFGIAILISLPIFLPEFPHANLVAVGLTTSFFTAFSIFVWSVAREISIETRFLESAGNATLEYLKVLFTFVRQAAFACVTLFGALFLAAYATGFKFADATASDKSDLFLLYVNIGFQVSFYAVYAIAGPVRYFFVMNIRVLSQFKEASFRVDRKQGTNKRKRHSASAHPPRKRDDTDDRDD